MRLGDGSYVTSSQLANKSFGLHSEGTAGWWLVHCFRTLHRLLSRPRPAYLLPPTVFFYSLLPLSADISVFSSSHQSPVPPGGLTGVHRRRLPPRAALGWAGQQRTQGHLPHYHPLLPRPTVCSRLGKTHAHRLTQEQTESGWQYEQKLQITH